MNDENGEILAEAEKQSALATVSYRLPFGRRSWRGRQGASRGTDSGNSIDFHDHRAYQYGDDPRYIHWAAYARTEQYVMKLYRAEQSPLVEIALDVTDSMFLTKEKERCTEALLRFCVASASRMGAPLRIYALSGEDCLPVPEQDVRSGIWREHLKRQGKIRRAGTPGRVSWRPQSMRILISDLLFAGDPSAVLAGLSSGSGVSLLFVPWDESEAECDVRGNVNWEDCESGEVSHRRVSSDWAARYAGAYQRHFDLWRESCHRYDVGMARVASSCVLKDALAGEALRSGLVELT